MISPPSNLSRFGFHSLIILMLCTLVAPALAQQADPTGQMPEAIRGAKIYQLPTKGGEPAPNPAVYKSLSFRDINFERLLLGLSLRIRPVDRAATVERMYFQDVKVNGIPVHIETFEQEFKLSLIRVSRAASAYTHQLATLVAEQCGVSKAVIKKALKGILPEAGRPKSARIYCRNSVGDRRPLKIYA